MPKIIKITETQIKNVLDKIVSEQLITNNPNPTSFSPQQNFPQQKPNLSCVKPEEFTQKGKTGVNSFIYRDGTKENVFYSNGDVWYYEGNNRLKTGKWSCGGNGLELRWSDDPKSVEYKPLPSQYFKKNLNQSTCAQKVDDINSGKFLFMGCQGPAVQELQKMLGFKNTTQYFGKVTKAALQKYQTSKGLKADGVFGRDTYSMMVKK